jgi:hypothetical protein
MQHPHQVEHARCCTADVQATASKAIVRLTRELGESRESGGLLARQLAEATEMVEMRTFEATSAKAYKRAAKVGRLAGSALLDGCCLVAA